MKGAVARAMILPTTEITKGAAGGIASNTRGSGLQAIHKEQAALRGISPLVHVL